MPGGAPAAQVELDLGGEDAQGAVDEPERTVGMAARAAAARSGPRDAGSRSRARRASGAQAAIDSSASATAGSPKTHGPHWPALSPAR